MKILFGGQIYTPAIPRPQRQPLNSPEPMQASDTQMSDSFAIQPRQSEVLFGILRRNRETDQQRQQRLMTEKAETGVKQLATDRKEERRRAALIAEGKDPDAPENQEDALPKGAVRDTPQADSQETGRRGRRGRGRQPDPQTTAHGYSGVTSSQVTYRTVKAAGRGEVVVATGKDGKPKTDMFGNLRTYKVLDNGELQEKGPTVTPRSIKEIDDK